MRWSPGRLRFLAHALGAIAAGLVVGFAITKGSMELALIGAALVMGLIGSVVIWLRRSREDGP